MLKIYSSEFCHLVCQLFLFLELPSCFSGSLKWFLNYFNSPRNDNASLESGWRMEFPVYIYKTSLALLLLNICTTKTGTRWKEMLAFKASLKNAKLGVASHSPSSLSAWCDSFALIHHRFIMPFCQNLQSKPHSCFCHLSVGNKREKEESKENTSPRSRAWNNGCEKRVEGKLI